MNPLRCSPTTHNPRSIRKARRHRMAEMEIKRRKYSVEIIAKYCIDTRAMVDEVCGSIA